MKNYLCKDCRYNNNGWCNKHSFNGLKKVTDCEDYKVDDYRWEENKDKINRVQMKKGIKKEDKSARSEGEEHEIP